MNTLFNPMLAIFGLGAPELLLIFAVLILLFGAKKLPELAKGLGKSIREFKKESNATDEDEVETEKPAATSAAKPKTKVTHDSN